MSDTKFTLLNDSKNKIVTIVDEDNKSIRIPYEHLDSLSSELTQIIRIHKALNNKI